MPGSLEALAVFAFAIAPGYALLTGYQHQRSHSAPERDLYVLGQAFVFSAAWLALTWWPAGHLLAGWAADSSLRDNELWAWLLTCVLFGAPYFVGRLAGTVVRAVAKQKEGRLHRAMTAAGIFDPPSLWDWIWTEARSRGPVLLIVRLRDGNVIEGQYASGSKADLSPRQRRVYLERAYGYADNGERVIYPGGAYIEGSEIVGIEFKS